MALAAEELWSPVDGRFDPDRLKTEVLDAFVRTQAQMGPYYDKWLKFYRAYRSAPRPKRPWRANVVIPIPHAEVEHGLAGFMDYWFSRRPMATLTPRESGDYDAARAMEQYLDWEADDIPLFRPMYEASKEMLLYGTGFQKVVWDWHNERNNVECVSVWNIYPDLGADNVEDARWIIERRFRPVHWVRRLARAGVYSVSEEEITKIASQGPAFQEYSDGILGLSGLDRSVWQNMVEVMEAWLADPPVVVTILNRDRVVRAHTNPFPHGRKPYVRWVDHHLKGEMFGVGEVELIYSLWEELCDIRNQRLDVVSLLVNNVLKVSRAAGVDPDDLVIRPGGIIWCNDPAGIQPLVQGGMPMLGVAEEDRVRFDIQQATANWGYNQGQIPARRETATTVLALQRAAGQRYGLKIRLNEELAFKAQVQMRISNAQHLLPEYRWIRVVGSEDGYDLIQVRRDDLQGTFDYIASVSPPEPRELKRAQLAQILPILLQHPRVNDRELLDWLLDLYGLGRDKRKILLSDEQMQEKLARQQQQLPQVQSPDLMSPQPRANLPQELADLARSEIPPVEEMARRYLDLEVPDES